MENVDDEESEEEGYGNLLLSFFSLKLLDLQGLNFDRLF